MRYLLRIFLLLGHQRNCATTSQTLPSLQSDKSYSPIGRKQFRIHNHEKSTRYGCGDNLFSMLLTSENRSARATHTTLYFTYNGTGKYMAQIIGATAIPEFTVPITILLCGILTLTVISLKKRRIFP